MNILQYESKIWATADLLRGCGIKESEWPSFMMPFFALTMIESRLVRMFDELKTEIGNDALAKIESRFRPDSKIEHGITLVDDKFYNEEFDVVIANPPYVVSWKGYQKDITLEAELTL